MNIKNAHLMTEEEREGAVRAIDSIIQNLVYYSEEIGRQKVKLAETGNPDYLAFVAGTLGNLLGNLRIDMLVKYASKPFIDRAVDAAITAAESESE